MTSDETSDRKERVVSGAKDKLLNFVVQSGFKVGFNEEERKHSLPSSDNTALPFTEGKSKITQKKSEINQPSSENRAYAGRD